MISIPYRRIALCAYVLMLVPIVVFLIGWVKVYLTLIGVVALAVGLLWLYRTDYRDDRSAVEIPIVPLVLIVCICGLWVAMSGNCGVFLAGYDIPWRDAILKDLIDYDWPVVYPQSGYALSYYFIFWMVPALAGKVAGWTAALVVLWLQQTLILSCAFLLMCHLVDARSEGVYWLVIVFLLLFSGINLLGAAVSQAVGYHTIDLSYNENYAGRFYYRSNVDCLEESYNQIVIWLAIPLMLENRKIHSYVFLGLSVLPFTPWCLAGMLPLLVVLGVVELIGYLRDEGLGRGLAHTLKEIVSPANIVAAIVLGVVFVAFFKASMQGGHVPHAEAGHDAGAIGFLDFSRFDLAKWAGFIVFALCEFGLFCAILASRYRKDPLFWAMVASLVVIPFIWIGIYEGNDFCMDGSLPALCLLMCYLLRYTVDEVVGKPLRMRNAVLVVLIAIAFLSPVMEKAGEVRGLVDARSLYVAADSSEIVSVGDMRLESVENFVCPQPEDTFFYTHLSRWTCQDEMRDADHADGGPGE